MDVIRDGIDLYKRGVLIREDTGDVGMEFVALFVPEKSPAVLGAEYKVNGVLCEGLRHGGIALTGLGRSGSFSQGVALG